MRLSQETQNYFKALKDHLLECSWAPRAEIGMKEINKNIEAISKEIQDEQKK